ncbi:class I SAM-dependent methyltransferase [Paenibacillus glycanilyticus]|uniref:class I SAM-dependent methyltransferase n=1 Tax=Paenibacillus glycanilyticus TaxID=126569 RepID=UPI001FD21FA6|nr:methyltransferase domain-containing protein [Paenibacillus glycanilyticus]
MGVNQSILFLKKYVQNPKYVGSIVPSSRFLANRMLDQVSWEQIKTVIELGAGTGAISRLMAKRLNPKTRVMIFEKDEQMRGRIQNNYSEWICEGDAMQLLWQLEKHNMHKVDCIISGLPFFNFSAEMRHHLIRQCVDALKPGGHLIAFQYSLQMRRLLS